VHRTSLDNAEKVIDGLIGPDKRVPPNVDVTGTSLPNKRTHTAVWWHIEPIHAAVPKESIRSLLFFHPGWSMT
ncbi:hypothetical protein, partial [Thermogutta sp.]|uniref:hypothetical protein n=1 Tax=Thermogutta sp. TaxID=1962930 RepID=UPI0025D4AB87